MIAGLTFSAAQENVSVKVVAMIPLVFMAIVVVLQLVNHLVQVTMIAKLDTVAKIAYALRIPSPQGKSISVAPPVPFVVPAMFVSIPPMLAKPVLLAENIAASNLVLLPPVQQDLNVSVIET